MYNLFGEYFVKRTAEGYIFKKDKRGDYIRAGSDIVLIPLTVDIIDNSDFSVPRDIITVGDITEEERALLRADAIILGLARHFSNYMEREWPDLAYTPHIGYELLENLRNLIVIGRSDAEIHDEFRRNLDNFITTLPARRAEVAREQRERDARFQAMRNAREERGEPVVSRETLLANFLSSARDINLPCPNVPPAEEVLDPIEYEPFRVGDRVIVIEDSRTGRVARFLFKQEPISRWWLSQTEEYTNPVTGEDIGIVLNSRLLPGFTLAVSRLGPPDPSAPVVRSNPLARDPDVMAQARELIDAMDEIVTSNPLAAAAARSGPRPPSTPRGAGAASPPGGGAGASSSASASVLNPLAGAAARSGPRPPSTPRPGAAPGGAGASSASASGASSSSAASVLNPLALALRKGGRRRTRNYKKSKHSKTVRKHKRRTHRQRSRR